MSLPWAWRVFLYTNLKFKARYEGTDGRMRKSRCLLTNRPTDGRKEVLTEEIIERQRGREIPPNRDLRFLNEKKLFFNELKDFDIYDLKEPRKKQQQQKQHANYSSWTAYAFDNDVSVMEHSSGGSMRDGCGGIDGDGGEGWLWWY